MEQDPLDSHRLAILFLVLALGALLDLDSPALSQESMQYYHLGRASLSLDSILEFQSIPAIQALVCQNHTNEKIGINAPCASAIDVSLHVPLLHRRASVGTDGTGSETGPKRELFFALSYYDFRLIQAFQVGLRMSLHLF